MTAPKCHTISTKIQLFLRNVITISIEGCAPPPLHIRNNEIGQAEHISLRMSQYGLLNNPPLNTPPYSDLILQVASTTKQTDTGVPSILVWTTTRHDILRTTNKDDSSSLSGSGFALPAKFSQIRSTSTKSVFNHQGAEFMPKSRATDRPMRFGPRYVESGHHTIRFVGETFTTHHRSSLDSCAKSWTHGCHVYPGHWFLLPFPLRWVYCPVTISPPSALYQAQSNRSISWETKINSWRVGKNFPTHTRRILFNILFIARRDRWRRTIRE